MVAGSRLCAGALLLFLVFLADVEGSLGSTGALWGDGDFMKISKKKTCDGSIGECFGKEEMLMDSEINRRILATSQYISYEALKADSVPCSKSGTSYYNCGSSGQANPYSRSCTEITRCARDTS
ncbi:hypothetical protein SUGI_0201940 [Cryptomeria japonica]|uniref:protein RALF-like 33 n=1 Tax=Cryptomeria japonica TaxID=3369 RepID=UPI002408DD70|nr:protein RALF-like 33 [Cryptomeria japonica]GLJ12976.1 hypothetical protein SUGI_0201940 [Cryptomeria japonica]